MTKFQTVCSTRGYPKLIRSGSASFPQRKSSQDVFAVFH